jgi:selenocysteine-specific elongation factor
MRSVIVGTAGHIDHGKTALVKALTGIDADRLEEEKRRGITIDLGFAHLELEARGPSPEARGASEKLRIGFVDVPGHERFVRNMLAGVGGIDVVLLVIAADEGVMPQTREHFDICRLLAVKRGLTVLTKSDLLDKETLDVLKLEVAEFVRGSFLEGAPIVPVSSLKGTGIDDLKRELAKLAGEVATRDASAIFRLPIDRVFVMKGFGTVVTGTTIAGRARKEDEVEIQPAGKRVRVRGVQVHGSQEEVAQAGERTALNLGGIAREELARGMVLTEPEALRPTARVDVALTLLKSAKPLRDRAPVHFHAYTAEMTAQVSLLGKRQMAPGDRAYAQLKLAEPMLLVPGDRFILRQFSPVVTIGGGEVLDATPLKMNEREKFLEVLAGGDRDEIVVARVGRRAGEGIMVADLAAEMGIRPAESEKTLAPLTQVHRVVRHGKHLIAVSAYAEWRKKVQVALDEFHVKNPLVAGISKEDLRVRLGVPAEVFQGVLGALTKQGAIEVAGEQVRLAGRGVVMKDEEAESKQAIERAFADAGLKVPLLKDVLAGVKVDKARAQKIMTLLLRERVLIKLSDDLVFHESALKQLRQMVLEQKAKSPKIDIAWFKDRTGLTRKYAIPLLEYLDRERVTRRVGDERVIL